MATRKSWTWVLGVCVSVFGFIALADEASAQQNRGRGGVNRGRGVPVPGNRMVGPNYVYRWNAMPYYGYYPNYYWVNPYYGGFYPYYGGSYRGNGTINRGIGVGVGGWPVGPSYGGGAFPSGPSFGGGGSFRIGR